MKAVTLTSAILAGVLGTLTFPALSGPSKLPAPVVDTDYYDDGASPEAKVNLGRSLFFDKILSGNQNISCATCHHPLTGMGDGLALPVGEGGRGLGMVRNTGEGADAIHERVPRNAPHVFNLGAKEFTVIFHDGRVQPDASQPSGFTSPAGADLPVGLDNVLAVQAMFPVQSGTEMAGQVGENSIADAADAGNLAGPGGVWEQLAQRLQGVPAYVDLFKAAYPGVVNQASDITYVQAANAIAAWEATVGRSDNSAFDRFLRGEKHALSSGAFNGMKLFYGKAGCSSCHSGKFQTDQGFHAIAMPQIGPGKGQTQAGYGADGLDDLGLGGISLLEADNFKFRTPTLRNVALTAPYGHDGAYNTLESVVRHHLDPVNSLFGYDTTQAALPPRADLTVLDFAVQADVNRLNGIAAKNELAPKALSDAEVANLVDFMHALTDPASLDLRAEVPFSVPSGLTVTE